MPRSPAKKNSPRKPLPKKPLPTKRLSEKALLFADREHGDQPICLECFARHKNALSNKKDRQEWEQSQQFTVASWEGLGEQKRQRFGLDGPHGWVKFLLESMKWPNVKGRCWGCAFQLAKAYRVLVEETKGAESVRAYCRQCAVAADDANALALEMDACGYKLGVPILPGDPQYAGMIEPARTHIASLQVVLAEPASPAVVVFWGLLHRRILKAMGIKAGEEVPPKINYAPLDLGATRVREIAVILKQTDAMQFVTDHNFAGVVQAQAKDPHNPPERLALVLAYQWAQELKPPMGFLELAQVLIAHGVVDGRKKDRDHEEPLAANIKVAVTKYRHLMPIQSFNFGNATE